MPDPIDPTALSANAFELEEAETAALVPEVDPNAPPVAVEGAPPAPAAVDPAIAAAAAEVPTSTAPEVPFAPSFAPSERDIKAELAAADAARTKLKEDYKAGTIDDDAYEAEFERLGELRMDLRVALGKEEVKAELQQSTSDQSWNYLQRQWLNRAENAGIDQVKSPLLFTAWESAMQMVVNENHAAGKAPLGDWQLFEAARGKLVDAGMLQGAPSSSGPTPPAPATPPKPDARSAPFAAVPQTLSNVPAASSPGSTTAVDDLHGSDIQDLEERLAGYSDSQREQLLRQTPGSTSYEAL